MNRAVFLGIWDTPRNQTNFRTSSSFLTRFLGSRIDSLNVQKAPIRFRNDDSVVVRVSNEDAPVSRDCDAERVSRMRSGQRTEAELTLIAQCGQRFGEQDDAEHFAWRDKTRDVSVEQKHKSINELSKRGNA
eukprot:3933294-Rhodomonas_salina.1